MIYQPPWQLYLPPGRQGRSGTPGSIAVSDPASGRESDVAGWPPSAGEAMPEPGDLMVVLRVGLFGRPVATYFRDDAERAAQWGLLPADRRWFSVEPADLDAPDRDAPITWGELLADVADDEDSVVVMFRSDLLPPAPPIGRMSQRRTVLRWGALVLAMLSFLCVAAFVVAPAVWGLPMIVTTVAFLLVVVEAVRASGWLAGFHARSRWSRQ